MALYDAWAARKRAELAQLAALDARGVTPSIRDLPSALRQGRRDLAGIPTLASAEEGAARRAAAAAVAADAAALAVLTDAAQGGSLAALRAASDAAGSTPVLRMDIVLHESQVYETRLAGADAPLLATPLLEARELRRLAKAARSTLMTPVFLIHGEADWRAAREAEARHALVSAERLDGGGEDLAAALALCDRIAPAAAVCLWAPSLATPEAVRALAGRVDGVLLPPSFPPASWAEVAVVEAPR